MESPLLNEGLAKADRLFRAAISGYCSLPSIARRDALRLDELAMPLLPLVADDTLRYAAAALSACEIAPPALLRRLCDLPVAISAPLLLASKALVDIDLIGIIGRNGLEHARAIAQRRSLNPNIASLVRALGLAGELRGNTETLTTPVADAVHASSSPQNTPERLASEPIHGEPEPQRSVERLLAAAARAQTYIDRQRPPAEPQGVSEEHARDRLRQMMRPSGKPVAPERAKDEWVDARSAYPQLVKTGLTGVAALFQTALADGLELDFQTAGAILDATTDERLATCLKAVGLGTAEAFFVAALACPPRYATTAAIRNFVESYRRADIESARRTVSLWRGDEYAALETAFEPANTQAAHREDERMLRAS